MPGNAGAKARPEVETTASGSARLQVQQFDYFVAQLLNFGAVGRELYGTAC
jgi:hypothetical protein